MAAGREREYGHAMVSRIAANKESGEALLGMLPDTAKMWMSHGDKLTAVPEVTLSSLVFFFFSPVFFCVGCLLFFVFMKKASATPK